MEVLRHEQLKVQEADIGQLLGNVLHSDIGLSNEPHSTTVRNGHHAQNTGRDNGRFARPRWAVDYGYAIRVRQNAFNRDYLRQIQGPVRELYRWGNTAWSLGP